MLWLFSPAPIDRVMAESTPAVLAGKKETKNRLFFNKPEGVKELEKKLALKLSFMMEKLQIVLCLHPMARLNKTDVSLTRP